jgi:hypothetical protein
MEPNESKMPSYIGTKIVCAIPMTQEMFKARKSNSEREVGDTSGYLVCYEDGYESWSPIIVNGLAGE